MADDSYVVDERVNGETTYAEVDDDSGVDWLTIGDIYPDAPVVFNLQYTYDGSTPLSATGTYTIGETNYRLVVNGAIENVRGSNGIDNISGTEQANILYGDQAQDGTGGNDVIFGAGGGDTVYGGAGNDDIDGAEGADIIFGDSGNDTVSGGGGLDVIFGDVGKDTLSGGAQNGDRLDYSLSDAGVTVKLTYGQQTKGVGGFAEGDTLTGFTDVTGSKFKDVITDTVNETIAFGYNASMFDGGAGNDILTLGGGNDIGIGGIGSDKISAGVGKDKLTGGAGKDLLSGGADADRFIFLAVTDSKVNAAGRDTITDFSHSQKDKIDLSAIDANGNASGDLAFDFIGKDAFGGHAGELRIKASGDGFLVQGDIDGDKSAEFTILVQDVAALKGSDFML